MIPLPQVLKRGIVANPVPKNQNKVSLADIEQQKQQRRMSAVSAKRRDYELDKVQKFNLATQDRPGAHALERVKSARNKELTKEHKFNDFKPKPLPDFTKRQAEVKLNAAALKREKALIDKEEREKAERLQQMEMGLKDASEF
jgi:hypothetical protein